jgi:hypothetical protein
MGTIQHACVLSGLTLGLLMGCAPAPETKPAAPEARASRHPACDLACRHHGLRGSYWVTRRFISRRCEAAAAAGLLQGMNKA